MNFNCDACQKLYSIADEKVQGRRFRVTCKQCGHVIVVRGSAQPAAPTVTPVVRPPRPGDDAPADLHDVQDRFFASEPAHRPRVTDPAPLQETRRHPPRLVPALGLAILLVAGGVALTTWRTGPKQVDPPPAPLAARGPAEAVPAPAPAPTAMPAPAVREAAPAEPAPADLPPPPPRPQEGARAPTGLAGRAGFESVGGPAGDDPRAGPRTRSLTISRKDRKLLDLLGKKGDAAPAVVARTELDSGKGSLDEVKVRQTLASSANGFAACVTRAVKADPHLRVNDRRATLNLTVKPSGVVSSAWISEADLDRSPLGKCLLSTGRRLVFPAFSGEEVEVAAPLALSTAY